jgi:glycine dehydrogenase
MLADAFALRHLGPRNSDLNYMFKTVGVESLDQLIFGDSGFEKMV